MSPATIAPTIILDKTVQRLRELLDQLDGFDARRHICGSNLLWEMERAHLRDAIATVEHIRRNGFTPSAI